MLIYLIVINLKSSPFLFLHNLIKYDNITLHDETIKQKIGLKYLQAYVSVPHSKVRCFGSINSFYTFLEILDFQGTRTDAGVTNVGWDKRRMR